MHTILNNTREFMDKFGQTVRNRPTDTLPTSEVLLRVCLIAEELRELAVAAGLKFDFRVSSTAGITSQVNLPDVLDGLTDLTYVVAGAYHTFGLAHLGPVAFTETHLSNMSKVWPDGTVRRRPDGKILKPDTFTPVNYAALIDSDLPRNPFNPDAK